MKYSIVILILISAHCAHSQTGNWATVGHFPNNHNKGLAFNIAIHPTNNNILFACAVGGLFKSTNQGATWQPVLSSYKLRHNFVTDVVIDPNNANNMIITTGRSTALGGSNLLSPAIYRSCNGGLNWVLVQSFENLSYELKIYDIEINRSNSNQVAIATDHGLYYSEDMAQTFELYRENSAFKNVQFNIFDDIFAAGDEVVKFSGYNRNLQSIIFTPNVIDANSNAVSIYYVSVTDVLYLKVVTNKPIINSGSLWKYKNNTLTKISNITANDLNNVKNNCIAVNTRDSKTIYLGGLTTHKSVDAGLTFNASSSYDPSYNNGHADVKNLKIDPIDPTRVYMMCDGGVFKSTNSGSSWNSITEGMDIKTAGKMYCSPHDPNKIVIGNQDTFSDYIDLGVSNEWTNFYSGDGSVCFIDINGGVYASSNGTTSKFKSDLSYVKGLGMVRAFAEDPSNPTNIYLAFDTQIKLTTDFADTYSPTLIADFKVHNNSLLASIDKVIIAPNNNKYMYAFTAAKPFDNPPIYAKLYKTTVGGGVSNWIDVTPPNPYLTIPNPFNLFTYISDMAVSHENPNKIWVTFGGSGVSEMKVVYSNDGGVNWLNKSEGLNQFESVTSIVIEENNNETVYIGTMQGIYYRSRHDATWKRFDCNLPNLHVNNLSIIKKDNSIRATLEGRGVWKSPLRSSPTATNYFLTSRVNINNHWDNTYYWRDFFQATAKIEISYNQSIIPNFTLIAGERILLKPGYRTYGNNMKAIIKAPSINANCLAPAIIANCTPIGLFRVESGDSVNTSQSDTLQKAETYKNTINSNKKNDQDIKSTIKIAEYKITISPNPTTSKVHLTTGFDGENEIVLTDITGKTLQTFTTTSNETDIDLSSYSNGMYFFKITNRLGKHIAKVMKIVDN